MLSRLIAFRVVLATLLVAMLVPFGAASVAHASDVIDLTTGADGQTLADEAEAWLAEQAASGGATALAADLLPAAGILAAGVTLAYGLYTALNGTPSSCPSGSSSTLLISGTCSPTDTQLIEAGDQSDAGTLYATFVDACGSLITANSGFPPWSSQSAFNLDGYTMSTGGVFGYINQTQFGPFDWPDGSQLACDPVEVFPQLYAASTIAAEPWELTFCTEAAVYDGGGYWQPADTANAAGTPWSWATSAQLDYVNTACPASWLASLPGYNPGDVAGAVSSSPPSSWTDGSAACNVDVVASGTNGSNFSDGWIVIGACTGPANGSYGAEGVLADAALDSSGNVLSSYNNSDTCKGGIALDNPDNEYGPQDPDTQTSGPYNTTIPGGITFQPSSSNPYEFASWFTASSNCPDGYGTGGGPAWTMPSTAPAELAIVNGDYSGLGTAKVDSWTITTTATMPTAPGVGSSHSPAGSTTAIPNGQTTPTGIAAPASSPTYITTPPDTTAPDGDPASGLTTSVSCAFYDPICWLEKAFVPTQDPLIEVVDSVEDAPVVTWITAPVAALTGFFTTAQATLSSGSACGPFIGYHTTDVSGASGTSGPSYTATTLPGVTGTTLATPSSQLSSVPGFGFYLPSPSASCPGGGGSLGDLFGFRSLLRTALLLLLTWALVMRLASAAPWNAEPDDLTPGLS